MNSKVIGDISEAAVIAALLRSGANVLIPFGDRCRYDVVVERDGKFERVQIKTGRQRGRILLFSTKSSTRIGGKRIENGYSGQIETFAVYHRELDRVYMVPIEVAAKGKSTLRLDRTMSKGPKCPMAEDFILHGALAQSS